MSASLFYDCYADYECPENYIEYNEGDKKFGELKSGDIIYTYSYSNEGLIEVNAKGFKERKGKIYISTEPFKLNPNSRYCKPSNKLEIGPVNSSRSGADDEGIVRAYSPNKAKDSSICVSYGGGYAFGTNREEVLKYAIKDITKSIQKIQSNIKRLQAELKSLNKKLKNL